MESALKHPDIGDRKADRLAGGRRQNNIVGIAAGIDAKDIDSLARLHGDLAVLADADEIRQFVAPDSACSCREHDVER